MRRLSPEFLIGIAVFVASAALCAPFGIYVQWIGDEGILLHGATQMLDGRHLYADFFEFYPPLGFIVTAAWLKVFGASILSFRALSIVIVAIVATLTYVACVQASRRPFLSAVLALAWVEMSQGHVTQVNHHYIATAFSMAALAGALRGDARGALIAGLASGAAGMVTQTRGALAAIASMAALGVHRRTWFFVVGCAAIPFLCIGYLLATGTLIAAWDHVIVWTLTQYAGIQSVPYGAGVQLRTLLIVVSIPLALALGVLLLLTSREARSDYRLRVGLAFAVAALLGAYPRPDVWHIVFAAPLGMPLLAYGLATFWERLEGRLRLAAAAAGIVVLLPSSVGYTGMVRLMTNETVESTPAGPGIFFEEDVATVATAVHALPAADGVFYYPYMPLMPLLARHENVANLDVMTPGYTSTAQFLDVCRQVARSADWVIYDTQWADPKFLERPFPEIVGADFSAAQRFEGMIKSVFTPVAQYGRFQVMRRRVASGPEVCR